MKIFSTLIILLLFFYGEQYSQGVFTTEQVALDGNNIRSYIWNTGVFDQNLASHSSPGFEWPKGSGHYAIYSAGLTIGAYVNNQLRMASASYNGEYSPGYCINGVFYTDSRFRLFRVTKGDNFSNNPDWGNWGLMVPYGAPYIDHNNNGIYEPLVDTPGVKGAAQTVFICITDADTARHTESEGFGGGTAPLFAEVHLTAWCYDNPGYGDMQFIKWIIINKNTTAWDSTIFSVVSDPDLGFPKDDYVGCDTSRNLGYCYNSDNNDDGDPYSYGLNPPAVGIKLLDCNTTNLKIKSFIFYVATASPAASCERNPNFPDQAYWYMKGFKTDGASFYIPGITPIVSTKFCYSGEPEFLMGWTEFTGRFYNCGAEPPGILVLPSPPGERQVVITVAASNRLVVGDTQVVQICQMIARGTNNLNSVTKLKQLADVAKNLCENNFVIGVTPISTQVPNNFALYQNYPNPFNPTTTIKFDVPLIKGGERTYGARGLSVKLTIYDALGGEVAMLVNEQLKPGTYETQWDASNYPSGVYFYKLETDEYSFTKKMVLIK